MRGKTAATYSTVIVREGGRSSIREMPMIESTSRSVLDARRRRHDGIGWTAPLTTALLTLDDQIRNRAKLASAAPARGESAP
jgi:hypothetical protein